MTDQTEQQQNKIVAPFKDIAPGFYGYLRPGWSKPTRVEVYVSEDFHKGESLVRFVKGFYGLRLEALAADAYLLPAADDDFPMR